MGRVQFLSPFIDEAMRHREVSILSEILQLVGGKAWSVCKSDVQKSVIYMFYRRKRLLFLEIWKKF